MLEIVHNHIIEEMKLNTRTDSIFVLTSIVLNFMILAINASLASYSDYEKLDVMLVFVGLAAAVNIVAEVGLLKGRQNRYRLLSGLLKMYKDQGVEGYYDSSLLQNYNLRYVIFMLVVLLTGIAGILVPFMIF